MVKRTFAGFGVLLLVGLGACKGLSLKDGYYSCEPGVEGACPSGMTCVWSSDAGQYRCFREVPGDDGGQGCGNGVVDQGEQCDWPALGAQTCRSLGFPGGALGCSAVCRYDTSNCDAPVTCGNRFVEPPEECDGTNLGGETCESVGYSGGTLTCAANCTFDTSACGNCFDGDGDGHDAYNATLCPSGDDRCDGDPHNWTPMGCASCADGDGDGRGDNCDLGLDCDDGDPGIWVDCATCSDGVENGNETDTDCGGPDCSPCPNGSSCTEGSDCQSGFCHQNTCTEPTCNDGVQNGSETDVDCGGPNCTGCDLGEMCIDDNDCLSGHCPQGVCESTTLFKTITVSSTDPNVLTDFQVVVELNPGNFNYGAAQPDGRDIRFSTDGVQFDIPYWIQSWNTTGTSRIWARVPSIPAGGAVDIYLLYGDSGLVDNSDGDATFEFFDDFEDGVYTNKWDVHGTPATLTESGGEVHLVGSSSWEYIGAQTSFSGPIVIHAEVMMTGTSCGLVLADANSDYRYTFRASGSNTGTSYDPDVSGSNSWEDSGYPGVPYTTGAWHQLTATAKIDGSSIQLMEYCNGANCNSTPRKYNQTGITAFVPGFSSWSSGHDVRARLIFVRKYTAYSVTATVN